MNYIDFLQNALFAHKVLDISYPPRGWAGIFEATTDASAADAALCYDTMRYRSDIEVLSSFRSLQHIPRIIVAERLGERGLMSYSIMSEECGYRLHRACFINSPDGEIAAMEFHKKD